MSLAFPKPLKPSKQKRRLRKHRKGSIAALKRKLDAIVGKIVRARGICAASTIFSTAHCWGPLQCAHGFSRRYLSTRWTLDNLFCLCARHHLFYTHRPAEWEQWMQHRLGMPLYLALQAKALAITQPTRGELEALLSELQPKEILDFASPNAQNALSRPHEGR